MRNELLTYCKVDRKVGHALQHDYKFSAIRTTARKKGRGRPRKLSRLFTRNVAIEY